MYTEIDWAKIDKLMNLAPQQRKIVRLLMTGASDKQIADNLKLSICTIRSHMQRLYRKYNVVDRVELIFYVVKTKEQI